MALFAIIWLILTHYIMKFFHHFFWKRWLSIQYLPVSTLVFSSVHHFSWSTNGVPPPPDSWGRVVKSISFIYLFLIILFLFNSWRFSLCPSLNGGCLLILQCTCLSLLFAVLIFQYACLALIFVFLIYQYVCRSADRCFFDSPVCLS